jgi:hypothetical protein
MCSTYGDAHELSACIQLLAMAVNLVRQVSFEGGPSRVYRLGFRGFGNWGPLGPELTRDLSPQHFLDIEESHQ